MSSVKYLTKQIGYQFNDIQLLETALSHRSYATENNERLEFLGDALLNFVIASELFKRFPTAKEGLLSRMRANLVKEETLCSIAKEFNLSEYLLLGQGEVKSGGAFRVSILADAVEAIIGAIYLDSDMQTCFAKVAEWYQERLNNVSIDAVYKDPKSLLQEIAQAKGLPLPEYNLLEVVGAEHSQHFKVECRTELLKESAIGEGSSRRRAEQDAASQTLEAIHGK